MSSSNQFPGFRLLGRPLFSFLLIVCALVGGLGWLGWRVLEQDRTLQSQRVQERLGTGADLVATAVLGRLVEIDDLLAQIGTAPDAQRSAKASAVVGPEAGGAVIVIFGRQRVDAFPPTGLRYYPTVPATTDAPADRFAQGEALEFRQKDSRAAISFYRVAARSPDVASRAGAIVRLARALRTANQHDEALAVYDQLGRLAPVRIGDVPVDLMARHARCVVLQQLQRLSSLGSEGATLHADIEGGRWQLTEGAYRFYVDEAHRWSGRGPEDESAAPDALGLAAATSALWNDWRNARLDGTRATGRRSEWSGGRPLLVIWRSANDHLVALVAATEFLERQWLSWLRPTLDRLNLQIALTDADGHPVYGAPAGPAGSRVVRSSAETGLPWTLHVTAASPAADLAQVSARRWFVLAGFGAMVLLIAVASYVTVRAAAREFEVSRLQSDFVSAVSHEFRTPLASIRQLSELLADGRVPNEQRRHDYYEDLRHESERLHRLVENLLDFGRMEAGAREYRFEVIDAGDLVRRVAEEFAREVAERGYRADVSVEAHLPGIRADGEALGRALWNLLDNAAKYSPDTRVVWVDVRREGAAVLICVRDEGLGIPPDEQRRIFDKFVRGTNATSAGIRGTGLGLAMVQRIVNAHGGDVRVTSEPGRGSMFTVVLPVTKEL